MAVGKPSGEPIEREDRKLYRKLDISSEIMAWWNW
jgi:hypothetical protein